MTGYTRWEVTHSRLLEVDHFRNSSERPQRRSVQVIADGDQGPHEGFRAAAFPFLAAVGGLSLRAARALVLSVIPAFAAARAEQLEQSADGTAALSTT